MGTSQIVILILLVILIRLGINIKKLNEVKKTDTNDDQSNNFLSNKEKKVSIPATCPHCKNPNTKRIRLCEW
jgi:hypothetical protein